MQISLHSYRTFLLPHSTDVRATERRNVWTPLINQLIFNSMYVFNCIQIAIHWTISSRLLFIRSYHQCSSDCAVHTNNFIYNLKPHEGSLSIRCVSFFVVVVSKIKNAEWRSLFVHAFSCDLASSNLLHRFNVIVISV